MPTRERKSQAHKNNPQVYGHKHQQERKRLLPLAYGQRCPGGCGRTMHEHMKLDSDHVPPLALHHHAEGTGCCYQRIICARCNRAAGARLANAARRARILAQARSRW